jgi:hypothetical protein
MALAIIMILYLSVGVLAAVGSMYLSYRFVPVRFEVAVYGVFLIFIAAFYLAFTSYFGDESAWRLETTAIVAFATLACLGIKFPILLHCMARGIYFMRFISTAEQTCSAVDNPRRCHSPTAHSVQPLI